MKVTQISAFIENRTGRLHAACQALAEKGVSIHTLSLADTREFGILRLIVCNPQKARAALEAAGFTVGLTEVVAVAVPDRPGGLADVLAQVDAAGLNIEYMYAFNRGGPSAIVILRFEDPDLAITRLQANGINVVAEVDLFGHVQGAASKE